MSQPSSSELAHSKLDQIIAEQAKARERDAIQQGTLDAILASMNLCADGLGTLVVEVSELTKAAATEPKSDIGETLRRLAEAVEQNTEATRGLIAVLTPPGRTH